MHASSITPKFYRTYLVNVILSLCVFFFPKINLDLNQKTCTYTQLHAAPALDAKKIQRPIKRLLKSIQYKKDSIALKSFDGHAQGVFLLSDAWSNQSKDEQNRFVKSLHGFFTLIAFPNLRRDLEHLETIIYEAPITEAQYVKQTAKIVVLHALKKQEVNVEFILKPTDKKNWLIFDFTIGVGDTFLTKLKRDQIEPLFKAKGWSGMMQTMEDRITQLRTKAKER